MQLHIETGYDQLFQLYQLLSIIIGRIFNTKIYAAFEM